MHTPTRNGCHRRLGFSRGTDGPVTPAVAANHPGLSLSVLFGSRNCLHVSFRSPAPRFLRFRSVGAAVIDLSHAAADAGKTWLAALVIRREYVALGATALILLAVLVDILSNRMATAVLEDVARDMLNPSARGLSGSGSVDTSDVDDIEMDAGTTDGNKAAPTVFPFPATTDGSRIGYRSFEGVLKPTLQGWCQEFGLIKSGKVDDLKSRLLEFSQLGPEGWAEWRKPGARRSHRGLQPGARKAPVKQSLKRRLDIFAGGFSDAPEPQPTPVADHRSKDERDDLVPWARRITAQFPYEPRDLRRKALQVTVPTATSGTVPGPDLHYKQEISQLTTSVSHLSKALVDVTANFSSSRDLQKEISDVVLPPLHLGQVITDTTVSLHTQVPAAPAVFPFTFRCDNRSISPAPISQLLPTSTALVLKSKDMADTLSCRTLRLGNGTLISFTERDVPDPPAVSFATNIPQLNRMWDDTSPHWDHRSHLNIDGQPIALVYWPELYKYWKIGQWQDSDIPKNVVERWREGTPAEFWEAFRDTNGKNLSWTAINATLVAQQKARDAELARQAWEEYGISFDSLFQYRKGSNYTVMTKDSTIAQRYIDTPVLRLVAGTPIFALCSTSPTHEGTEAATRPDSDRPAETGADDTDNSPRDRDEAGGDRNR
ncbi:hypothetical protein H0H81_004196 [Sphagnurus paluster]|uniref:Uncharacterized protein n=1 Tax=Sphagnurus paluster TaxID=117069 RepID=A0A9P7K1B2_9AGAR|nr:hypothetical protein H0H81_004196 [Sphagnurus paluster]